jgi:hypothetical protein
MMQTTDSTHKNINLFYEGIVEMVSHSEVDVNATLAVLTKVLVLLALSTGKTKEQFFEQIDYVWEYENFFQPDSNEKH